MLIKIRSIITYIHDYFSDKPKQPAKTDNIQILINEAENQKLYYEEINLEVYTKCNFISCNNQAILFLEGVYVCEDHGFRLIKRLTEKTNNDNVSLKS